MFFLMMFFFSLSEFGGKHSVCVCVCDACPLFTSHPVCLKPISPFPEPGSPPPVNKQREGSEVFRDAVCLTVVMCHPPREGYRRWKYRSCSVSVYPWLCYVSLCLCVLAGVFACLVSWTVNMNIHVCIYLKGCLAFTVFMTVCSSAGLICPCDFTLIAPCFEPFSGAMGMRHGNQGWLVFLQALSVWLKY